MLRQALPHLCFFANRFANNRRRLQIFFPGFIA